MIAKCFEIRDRGTFFPAIAVKLLPQNEAEAYLVGRAGFTSNWHEWVYFFHMEDNRVEYDPFKWLADGTRTRHVAHDYIAKHFDELEPGAVIDVEFILGESTGPKRSERQE